MKKLSPKKLLGMKTLSVALLLLLGLFGFNFIKEFNRNRQLNSEIKKLEAVAKEIEAKNLDVLNLAKYLDTEEFLESEARTKLGLQKPGEQTIIVNFPGMEGAATEATEETAPKIFNPYEWWKYFFEK
ncbi:septum formation initiator family protein [Patescibacteria group bacterium]|nr:septum formation initiator family protein [Patescibacteria group bacterium]